MEQKVITLNSSVPLSSPKVSSLNNNWILHLDSNGENDESDFGTVYVSDSRDMNTTKYDVTEIFAVATIAFCSDSPAIRVSNRETDKT